MHVTSENTGRIRKILGILILLISSAILVWGLWPTRERTANLILQVVSPEATSGLGSRFPPDHSGTFRLSTGTPALEPRRSRLSWPAVVREGDARQIHLQLDEAVEQVGEDFPSSVVGADYNLLAEARLDMAGVEVLPRETVSQPLRPGETVRFVWTAKPEDEGEFQGTVWLYFHFIPLNGFARESQQAISAQTIEIRTVDLLGMGGRTARVIGVCGVLLGIILIFDRRMTLVKIGRG